MLVIGKVLYNFLRMKSKGEKINAQRLQRTASVRAWQRKSHRLKSASSYFGDGLSGAAEGQGCSLHLGSHGHIRHLIGR